MFQSASSFVDPSARGGESRTPNPMGAPFGDRLAGTPLASARAVNATSPRARGEGTGGDDGRDAMMAYGGTTPRDARGAVGVERGLASRDGDASRAAPKFSSLLLSAFGARPPHINPLGMELVRISWNTSKSGVTKVLKGRFTHSAFKPQLKIHN